MEKFKKIGLSILVMLSCSVFATQEVKEQRGQELCAFAKDFFLAVHNQNEVKLVRELRPYMRSQDPTVKQIATTLIQGLEEGTLDTDEVKGEAVSQLGRLIKCSVDTATTYQLYKKDLVKETQMMQALLSKDLPKKEVNYHKLMIESLADNRCDIALYAYLKIAEERCQD